ncbi:type II toxin-antitoxin system prevent-host-death family antitoxin [Streptomyces sp. NPDC050388]|uniref:type II toxin-antitoxin system prevent-host-death family antitoxin n=1 Tax=Streptomyces sp. NPDC050388 TaxID=3155781 RepID=UPI00341ABFA5
MTEMTISEAASRLEDLVHRLGGGREPVVLTDESGVTALLVAPQVIEDLEDALAIAEYRRRKAEGTLEEGIPHAEVGRLLGLRP